ncbi:MAG: metal-dependent transcriptional regulator [Spirochaetia bacterium]|jgi:Mn-dependent DtxR family transcriptional regulator|nr:metal-dependent transcriptional regulator [Spirochaetia bacterium]
MKTQATNDDYLEAIFLLLKQKHKVRSIDLAQCMERSKASVSLAISSLRKGGFLTMDQNKFLHLTPAGERIARQTHEKHLILSAMLVQIGVDSDIAQKDAYQIAHVISNNSFQKLKIFYKNRFEICK